MSVSRKGQCARRQACALVLIGALAACACGGQAPLRAQDVDAAASASFIGGEASPVPRDVLLGVLGLGPLDGRGWSVADPREHEKETFHYRIAFSRPVRIGSVWLDAGELRLLRADAPLPGDPAKAEHWTIPPVPPDQCRPHLITLPAGTSTRALLVTVPPGWRRQPLRLVRLARKRWFNATPEAVAQADAHYTLFHQLGPPHIYAAENVVRGRSRWQNAGPDERKRIYRPPVSDLDPSWFVLSWDSERTVHGLVLKDNFQRFELHRFAGAADISPVAAVEREWKRVDDSRETSDGGLRWIWFAEPVATRGLRVLILKTGEKQIAKIESLHVLTDLGTAPVPKAAVVEAPAPPCRVPYTLEHDGMVTLAIDGPDGRVRNLVARAARKKGPNAEAWDLRDGDGRVVAPGSYTWKAITWPPLQLRYEMTPYPNIVDNAPGNSPWANGHSGPGGWLADHTPPFGVCTAGDWVFLGAPCAESGQSFIACDLEGRKQWGIHSFAAWTGPKRMATNGTTVYIENQAWRGSGEEGMDRVWAVDVATHKVTPFLQRSQSERRRRGIAGMAADAKHVYLAIRGKASWLTNAVGIGDVDIENCLPRYKKQRQSSPEGTPDYRDDFIRLFRISGTPAGWNGLVWLESTKGPSPRQHIVLAFKKQVSIGSLAFPKPDLDDVSMKLSLLKADGAYPPDPDDEAAWLPFGDHGTLPWNVVAAPAGQATRALRISFTKGADDELAGVLGDGVATQKRAAWMGRIEGMKLLKRRYKNLAGTARVRVNSGTVADDGSWDAERKEPLTREKPGIYVLEWDKPQRVRGLAIQEIDGKECEIDLYDGPAGPVDIDGPAWKQVATYEQKRRYYYQPDINHSSKARYMDGYVDFGREVATRAIRLRIVSQWVVRKDDRAGLYGVRDDRGGMALEPHRCRVYGVAPVQYLGGGPPEDPLLAQRIEVLDAADAKVLQEVAIEEPGDLALDPDGRLFGLSGARVVAVDLEKGNHKPIVTDLERPTCLAFDSKGDLYVYDDAPGRRVVRVYDRAGKHVRTLGTPGGYRVGAWDPTRFEGVGSIAVDRNDRLWAVSFSYWPKRICQWDAREGRFLKDFLGNTQYGGGGVLDPWDKRRLIYGNLEFELDWTKGSTRLKNLLWPNGWESGEVPIRLNGRTYVVTRQRPARADRPIGIVYIHEKDRLRRVAAVGLANYFSGLRTPDILRQLGTHALEEYQFTWTDRSGDGEVQPDEVTFSPKRIRAVTPFNRDLGCQAGSVRFVAKEFLPNGAPVYEEQDCPGLEQHLPGHLTSVYRLDDGTFFRMGDNESRIAPDGKVLWDYKTEGAGVHALTRASQWHPSQVVCEFGWVGHERAHAGGLGEFVVLHANIGAWNIWTSDGLLCGPVFRDIRQPGRLPWSMREHERGLRLDDVTAGQEHFQGYFCRTREDDKYYIVAGHNHASVVEVVGLDQVRRLSGTVEVSGELVRSVADWEREDARRQARGDVKVADVYRRTSDITIDGQTDDWGGVQPLQLFTSEYGKIHGIPYNSSFRIAYDDAHLFVAYETQRMGPLKNSGNQWDRLFKTGAACDLQMGVDPTANAARKRPVEGDFRLLMTYMDDGPAAVLYRPVAPGAPESEAWKAVSPVWSVAFDQVKRLDGVAMARSGDADRYTLEAAIPLKALGLKPQPQTRVKLDWGVLAADRDGTTVLHRSYWSNKATSILSDAPSEAALHPDMWGTLRIFDRSSRATGVVDPDELLRGDDDELELELEEK